MNNEEKILSLLETVVADVADLKQGQAKLEQGQAETNQRLDNLEKDVKVIKEDVRFTRALVDEAFKDIDMLDTRTESLKRAK